VVSSHDRSSARARTAHRASLCSFWMELPPSTTSSWPVRWLVASGRRGTPRAQRRHATGRPPDWCRGAHHQLVFGGRRGALV